MLREHVFINTVPAGCFCYIKAEHQNNQKVKPHQTLHLKHSNNIINHNILLRILLV